MLFLACVMVMAACGTKDTNNGGEAPAITESPEKTDTTEPVEPEESEEVSEFAKVLRELHLLDTYEERETYVEKMEDSDYSVVELDNLELITHANGEEVDLIYTYDMETNEYIKSVAPNSRIVYPVFDEYTYVSCCNMNMYEEGGEMPTGEVTLMGIKDLSSGEVDPWGVKIYKAGTKEVEEESELGWSYSTTVIDPESPVTVAYCTIEELVNSKNTVDSWDYYHEKNLSFVEPVRPLEYYDDAGNPTGEYFYYEVYQEKIYVEEEELIAEQWGDQTYYYFWDEFDNYWNVYRDEENKCFYIYEELTGIPVNESNYTVVENAETGLYMVDKEGNVVMEVNESISQSREPLIATWDTLKYYNHIYNPQFWQAFSEVISYGGSYAVTDMKAEDYPYLSEDDFESLVKRYTDTFDIVLDEEILAIRASVPESWDKGYKEYIDKEGWFSLIQNDESEEASSCMTVTIDRPENWYFNCEETCRLAVKDESIWQGGPAYMVTYAFSEIDTKGSNVKKAAETYLLDYFYADSKEVNSFVFNAKPVYYIEERYDWSNLCEIRVLQDIGLGNFVKITIDAYDIETDTRELIGKFLLDDNYSVEQ